MRNAAILPTIIPPLVYEFRANLIKSLGTANVLPSDLPASPRTANASGFELARFRTPIIDILGGRSPFLSMYEGNEKLPAALVKEVKNLDDVLDLSLHSRAHRSWAAASLKRFDKALKVLGPIAEDGKVSRLTTRTILRSRDSMRRKELDALTVVAGEMAAAADKMDSYYGRHKVQFLSGLMYASLPEGQGASRASDLLVSSAQLFFENGYHMTAAAIFEAASSLYLRGEQMDEPGVSYLTHAIDSWNLAVQGAVAGELLKDVWGRTLETFITPEEWRAVAREIETFLDRVDEVGALINFIPDLEELGALADGIADDFESDLPVLNDALGQDRANPYILHERGMLRVATGDLEEGVKDLFQASARLTNPPDYLGDLGDAYRLLAQRLYREGEAERAEAVLGQAVETLDKAMARDENDALNRLRRAVALVLANDDEAALEDIDIVLMVPSTAAMAQQLLDVIEHNK